MVTFFILCKVDKIQDAHMDTFLEFVVRIALFQLPGVHPAQIEQYPVCPVSKVYDLHFQIDLRAVFQKDCCVQHAHFVVFILGEKPCGYESRFPDVIRLSAQQRCNKSLSYVFVLHQFFKTEIYCGKHYEIVVCLCHGSFSFPLLKLCSYRKGCI